MSKYEELEKKLQRQYRESAKRFTTQGPGVGDEKRLTNNRDMQRLKEAEVKTLIEMQIHAPSPAERAKVDAALEKTRKDASDFKGTADRLERKLNKGS